MSVSIYRRMHLVGRQRSRVIASGESVLDGRAFSCRLPDEPLKANAEDDRGQSALRAMSGRIVCEAREP
jgi:hypothetical protein